MGKQDDDNELQALLCQMPIAQAILQNDLHAMSAILQDNLPVQGTIVVVESMKKSVGEKFTGGSSTPVYQVCAQVTRPFHNPEQPKRRHFIVKLVLMPETDSYTLARRESYAVERRFYETTAKRVRNEAQLHIPKLIASDWNGSKAWPAFCILMNDVSLQYPQHPAFLSKDQALCALLWIAKFHAMFWSESSSIQRDLWDRGAFWTTTSVGTEGIAATWIGTMRFLEQKYPQYTTGNTKSLGRRIETVGAAISRLLAKQSSGLQYGTLIHGDYKAANLFFQRDATSASSVAAVDFQFAGCGLGVEDVAYLLYPDARGNHFDYEEELLKVYHEELILQLMTFQKGGPSTMPFEVFQRYYELARLDMTRYWLSKSKWVASTEGEAKLVSVLESTMDRIDGGQVLGSKEEYESALLQFVDSLST